ncbi:MAG: hypothetical protein JNK07_19875 [Alphaproteobacteria bacterium]|nr:hypothetical protein [Alphaproteobacteria bacterium]
MLGRLGAALAAAAVLAAAASADDPPRPAEPAQPDVTLFESSARLRLNWSEIAFRGNRPKAWDHVVSPEVRANIRVLAGLFEGKAEIGFAADHFAHFSANNVEVLRGEVQLGLNTGDWSYLVEWKGRDVFEPGVTDFLVGLNTYDVRVRHRFTAGLFDGLPVALVQASAAAGYVAATPELFAKTFAEFEVEALQRLGGGFTLMLAPKLELSDYRDFASQDRKDALLSLRIVPAYNFGGGLTLSLEGQASIALSTLATKTGETWELTPILRLQKSL